MPDSICSVADCTGKTVARGWCRKHYQRWHTTGDVADKPPRPTALCSVEGCANPVLARGWCRNHYYRWRNNGDPLGSKPRPRKPIETRFWSKVDMSAGLTGCWPWMGTRSAKGYGTFRVDSRTGRKAHRVAYELATGESLGDLQIDHKCFNPACCNPIHLRPATNKQNRENHHGNPGPHNIVGLRGVSKRPSGRFVARVGDNYEQVTVGTFDTPEEAAEAARLARLTLHTFNDFDRSRETCE